LRRNWKSFKSKRLSSLRKPPGCVSKPRRLLVGYAVSDRAVSAPLGEGDSWIVQRQRNTASLDSPERRALDLLSRDELVSLVLRWEQLLSRMNHDHIAD
jgi:hypothetical protein